ncbi:hypothetical protein HHK36_010680 [Tetracentron sinense]|uniref:MSP domain-containing protein n=1 Tax=Tetracentron sinense TaxID=13715 RepID=A0A834ZHA6_TETSI|nr:hypothetical protein HHK36_010680 [Tetracentron sinense]
MNSPSGSWHVLTLMEDLQATLRSFNSVLFSFARHSSNGLAHWMATSALAKFRLGFEIVVLDMENVIHRSQSDVLKHNMDHEAVLKSSHGRIDELGEMLQCPMERLVEVSHPEVRIEFEMGCKCRANVRLKSLSTTTPIAFKVQTSSPQKFLVNPPSGLIPPLSHATFQVILKPQSQLPSSFPRSPSDRFLVKSAEFSYSSSDSTHPDSINSWFSSGTPHMVTHDLKLKVAYVGPFLLRHAVSIGDTDAVKNLIKRQKSVVAELSPEDSESLLRLATESYNSDNMVNLLAEAGLKTDARVKLDDANSEGESRRGVSNSKGWTEIHVAAAFDRADELLRLIKVSTRSSLDCRDREGRTPLHLAAIKRNVRCASLLVEAGADKNARSKDGGTALYKAAEIGDRQMVATLIEMGADPTIPTTICGRSPLDVARDKGHKEVVEILERGELVLTAARRGELGELELLLKEGASAKYRDQYGLTALHAAAIKGHKEAVSMLVEHGIDLECQDGEGHTPLHLAVEGGSIETVQVLINSGANVNAKSKRDATPLYMARAMGYDDISQFLLNRGASSSSLPSSSSSSLSSIL